MSFRFLATISLALLLCQQFLFSEGSSGDPTAATDTASVAASSEGRNILDGWVSRVRHAWDAGNRIEALRCYRAARQTARLFGITLTGHDKQLLELVARYEGKNSQASAKQALEPVSERRLPGCDNTPASDSTAKDTRPRNIPDATKPIDTTDVGQEQARRRAEGLLAQSRAAVEPSRRAAATILEREADRVESTHIALNKQSTGNFLDQLSPRHRSPATKNAVKIDAPKKPTLAAPGNVIVAPTPVAAPRDEIEEAPDKKTQHSTDNTPEHATKKPSAPTIPTRTLVAAKPGTVPPGRAAAGLEPVKRSVDPAQPPPDKPAPVATRVLPLAPGAPPVRSTPDEETSVQHTVVPPVTAIPQTTPATPEPPPAPLEPRTQKEPTANKEPIPEKDPATEKKPVTDTNKAPSTDSAVSPVAEPPSSNPEPGQESPLVVALPTAADTQPSPVVTPPGPTDSSELNQMINGALPRTAADERAKTPSPNPSQSSEAAATEPQVYSISTVLIIIAPILIAMLILGMMTQEMPLPGRLVSALAKLFSRKSNDTPEEDHHVLLPAVTTSKEPAASAAQTLLVRIVTKKRSGKKLYSACILLPGTEPTRMVRQRDGKPYFNTRSAALTSARHLARRLGFGGIEEEATATPRLRSAA